MAERRGGETGTRAVHAHSVGASVCMCPNSQVQSLSYITLSHARA